ncbi:hypothetical protein JCM5350_003719 [Sporobolomyces pararoseus]
MSGLLQRYSSYSSSSASHHIRPSPSSGSESPPSDPFPPFPNALKPSDVLINRSHQLKRFAKHLSLYFQALSQAHHAHALSLQKLPQTIPLPIQEASIFLPSSPPPPPPPQSSSTSLSSDLSNQDYSNNNSSLPPVLGGTGQEGWAQILQEIKSTNERVCKTHLELSKSVIKEVVGPLNKLREMIKGHINAMEKDVNRLCDLVQKERDLTAPLLAKLESALSTTKEVSPLRPQFSDDPLLIRAQLESQISSQLQKENDLLISVKNWTEKTFEKERELFTELSKIWRDFERMNSGMLLGNQQLSMFLSATVDSVPPESEWNYFLKLNHTIPQETPLKSLKDVDWKGKGDDRCMILLEGNLERQTSFLKSWKPAYFILTATGHLLLYQPPVSNTPPTPNKSSSTLSVPPPVHHSISNPTTTTSSSSSPTDSSVINADPTSLSSISPTGFHLLTSSTPIVSLHLPNCSLGPMPTPEHVSPSPTTTETDKKKKKGGVLDAAFTLIENQGKGTKHIMRAVPVSPKRLAEASIAITDGREEGEEGEDDVARRKAASSYADEWETMGIWIKEISKFTLPAPPSPILPSLPISPSSLSTTNTTVPPTPPAPALPSRSTSPPLPNLPSPPLVSVPTPASTSIFGGFFSTGPRSSVTSTTTSKTATTNTTSVTEDEEEEVDLGGGGPPPLPPRDRDRERTFSDNSSNSQPFRKTSAGVGEGDATSVVSIEDEPNHSFDDEEEEEDRGDLGRSLSSPPQLPSRRVVPPPPTLPVRTNSGSGRVANLAKAFDQEATKNSSNHSKSIETSSSPKLEQEEGETAEEEEDGKVIDETTTTTNEQGTGGGKKNKKKKNKKNGGSGGRKSNERENEEEDAKTEKPRLSFDKTATSSPKSLDLSLASPPLDLGDSEILDDGEEGGGVEHNPFELNLNHLKLEDNNDETQEKEEVEGGGGAQFGDLSFDEAKLEREYGEGLNGQQEEEESQDVTSPPPMVLEEVQEGPRTEGLEGEETEEKHDEVNEGEEVKKEPSPRLQPFLMSFLPPLGTVYPTLDHFRLDVYTRAVCSHFKPQTDNRKRCESRIYCKVFKSGQARVYDRESTHTCQHIENFKDPTKQKMKMLGKKQEIEEVIIRVGARFQAVSEGQGCSSSLMRLGERYETEEIGKVFPREGRNSDEVTSTRTTTSSIEPTKSGGSKFEVSEGFFRRAVSLQRRIDELKTSLVHLPVADEPFSTHEELLARLYAFSQQRGVLLERCTVTATSSVKELLCSHNYREYEQVAGGRCPVIYTIKQNSKGNWSLSYPLKSHSHPICPPSLARTSFSGPFNQHESSTSLPPPPSDRTTSFSLSRLPLTLPHSRPSRTLNHPLRDTGSFDTGLNQSISKPCDPPLSYKSRSIRSSTEPISAPASSLLSAPASIPAKRSRDSSTSTQSSGKAPRLSNQEEGDAESGLTASTSMPGPGLEKKTEHPSPADYENVQLFDEPKQETNPFSLPCSVPSPASLSATLSSSHSSSSHDEPIELDLNSLLLSFQPRDKLFSTLSALESKGINSLDIMMNVLLIGSLLLFQRLVEGFEGETGELLRKMRKDFQEFVVE